MSNVIKFFTINHLKHQNKPFIICGSNTSSASTTKIFGWLGAIIAITRVILIITLGITEAHQNWKIIAGFWAELVFLLILYASFVSIIVYGWSLESSQIKKLSDPPNHGILVVSIFYLPVFTLVDFIIKLSVHTLTESRKLRNL